MHAAELENVFDYTIMALSTDSYAITLNVNGGNINGNVASNSSFTFDNVNINGQKQENAGMEFANLLSAINEKYFCDAAEYNSSDECGVNINGSVRFTDSVVFENGVNLNGSLKANGDISLSGTININNGCIVSENGNITIDTENISLMGLVYAPNGTLTLNGNNINLNNVCIIADKINITCQNSVNISSNNELINFVRESAAYNGQGYSGDDDEIIDIINPYELLDFGNFSQFIYASAKLNDYSVEINWITNIDGDSVKLYEIVNENRKLVAEVVGDSTYTYQYPAGVPEILFVVEKAGVYSYPFKVSEVNGALQLTIDDTDGDGLNDALEKIIDTDIYNIDTDGDGLNDYYEIIDLGTNPLERDTDKDGIEDYLDDMDGDGISNQDEYAFNTNPFTSDSDDDQLSDWNEIYTYHTNPLLKDTDSDGADDKYELDNGYDPLVPNASFVVEKSYGEVSEANPVSASVRVELSNGPIDSLTIEKVNPHDNPFITPSVAGIMGTGYSFEVDADFQTAELIFEYDTEIYGELSDEFQPRIYYFNEDTKMFEELENQIVENGTVRAITTHFSSYALINKPKYESVWKILISSSLPSESDQPLPVIVPSFPIDSSIETPTSTPPYLNPNNGNYLYIERIIDAYGPIRSYSLDRILGFEEDLAKRWGEMVDVDFWDNIYYCYNSAGNGDYSDQTHVSDLASIDKNYDYLWKCNYRYAIVLVSFYGSHLKGSGYEEYYDHLLEYAKNNHIVLNIISLSNGDRDYLKNIANQTGGDFYLYTPQDVERLLDTIPFELVGSCTTSNPDEDMVTDSNNDGISDYYTRLIKEGKLLLSNSSNEFIGVDFNYDCNGNFSDDWDGDGLKNGEEIQIDYQYGRYCLSMTSHPMREYSDGDLLNDYEEVQNGTDPFVDNYKKDDVDWLTNDYLYSYEGMADILINDSAIQCLVNYSAIINGVYNKSELCRDLIIDYYSTYITQDVLDEEIFMEEKKCWIDYLITLQSSVGETDIQPSKMYELIKNINVLINYMNGYSNLSAGIGFDRDFANQIVYIIQEIDKISKDATEFRASVYGNSYIKKYLDSGKLIGGVDSTVKFLNNISLGLSIASYGIDVYDTVTNLSKVNANNQLFAYNMDALDMLFVSSKNDSVRAAALDVKQVITGQYISVLSSSVVDDVAESAANFIILQMAQRVSYVAVVVAVRDVALYLINSKADLQQIYRIICYSEMCSVYSNSLKKILIQTKEQNYYWTYDTTVIKVYNYLANIAQLRVLGEQEYYNYVKAEGALSFVINTFNGLSDVKENINYSMSKVKMKIDSLFVGNFVSSSLIYSIE